MPKMTDWRVWREAKCIILPNLPVHKHILACTLSTIQRWRLIRWHHISCKVFNKSNIILKIAAIHHKNICEELLFIKVITFSLPKSHTYIIYCSFSCVQFEQTCVKSDSDPTIDWPQVFENLNTKHHRQMVSQTGGKVNSVAAVFTMCFIRGKQLYSAVAARPEPLNSM